MFSKEKTPVQRDDPVKTAMFCRFRRVSTCACKFLLRNSGVTSSRARKPYPRGWSCENSYVLSMLTRIYVPCACTFLLRNSRVSSSWWENPIREDDLVKTAMFCRFWRVSTCACKFLLRNSGTTSSREKYPNQEDDLVKTAMFCRFRRESTCACNFLLRNSRVSSS